MKSSLVSPSLHPDIQAAYGVLAGQELSKDLALRLSRLTGPDLLDLMSLAHKVMQKYAPRFHACTIMNIKSGACPENCSFCAQSSYHHAAIDIFPLLSLDKILAQASQAYANGIRTFGLVTSGTGYLTIDSEFQSLLIALQTLHQHFPDLQLCGSFGNLTAETVQALAEVGLVRYNINLQVNPDRYRELVSTTHSLSERIQTIRLLKHYRIEACTGGIIGLGETMADRVEMAFTLKALGVEFIPLNVLIPIPGTALENQPPVPVSEILKTFALFRLILPQRTIKFAAGRETRMKDFQGLLMLAGANGFLTGGYLTTRGREISEDQTFLRQLQEFHV